MLIVTYGLAVCVKEILVSSSWRQDNMC